MEAPSHGKGGNQINCMSVNRITSSLTCHESGLKLLAHAWRSGKSGEERVAKTRGAGRGGEGREVGGRRGEQGFPLTVGTPSSARQQESS